MQIANRKCEGVALIITLILLSVALVMTVAFLAISGHEKGSVTTQTNTTTARLAAEAGLAAAEAQIAANLSSSTNPFSFGLIVSTNYLPPATGNPLTDLTNLLIAPRAPVWLTNYVLHAMENRFYLDLNRNGRDDPNGWVPNLDNTRNSLGPDVFEVGDPEWIGVLEHPDRPHGPNNKFIARFAVVAQPVGNALDLNAIHNQTLNQSLVLAQDGYFRNQGVGSWEINLAAFLADLNTNVWDSINYFGPYQYRQPGFPNTGNAFNDAFMLLTNRYAGNYFTQLPVGGTLPRGLFTTANVFPPFQNNIDAYDMGPLQTTVAAISVNPLVTSATLPWAGADNTNRYFAPGDLFNLGAQNGFGAHLLNAGASFFNGTTNSTYDRYTFYRLLAQLGTDTTPDSGKMNLNYDNLVQANPVSGAVSGTNFIAWTPLNFFTNAADRLLKASSAQWAAPYGNTGAAYGTGANLALVNTNFVATFNVTAPFGVTGIPVWVSNRFVYTPAVQRLLQLAANLYDASTNAYFPSVFRPTFWVTNELGFRNVYVNGYQQVVSVFGTGDPALAIPTNISALASGPTGSTVLNYPNGVNVYGVPWIIGAKKGFPNFNEFVQENIVGVTRRLQVTRDVNDEIQNRPKVHLTGTNQMYLFSINSSVGLDFWNSYNSNFTDNVTVVYRGVTWMSVVTNNAAGIMGGVPILGMAPPFVLPLPFAGTNTFSGWPGSSPWLGGLPNPSSFKTPFYYLYSPVLMPSVYRGDGTAGVAPPALVPTNNLVAGSTLFETGSPSFPPPHFGLLTTNRLQVFILDNTGGGGAHVIDYVQLEQNTSRDLNAEIFTDGAGGIWNTNPAVSGIPLGIANQINISKGLQGVPTEDGIWQSDTEALQYGTAIPMQQASFMAFFQPWNTVAQVSDSYGQASATNYYASAAAPYAPTRYAVTYTLLQANDPLVHYLTSDMTPSSAVTNVLAPKLHPSYNNYVTNVTTLLDLNLGSLNYNYQPWGGNPQWAALDPNRNNLAERDPIGRSGFGQSDDWNFPNNKFPTAGWMGRVHRGTPWQTVYLKSPNLLGSPGGFDTWRTWSGNPNSFDAANAAPIADRLLFDLFTTAPNDNASRGTLSVNVGADRYAAGGDPAAGLAAWSALFSGMVVAGPTNYSLISPAGPAGVNSALGSLVTNINYTRANFRNPDGLKGVFEHAGDILAAPALTDRSPFLDPVQTGLNSDAMYEWLPQQMMSLVRLGTPRYVVYSYGQALKPAPGGVYLGAGPFFGMVTNYQVVSETATRAVLRIETARTNYAGGAITVTPPRVVLERFNNLPPD